MWRLGGLHLHNSARPIINPFAKIQTNHMFAAHLPYPLTLPITDESMPDISIPLLNQSYFAYRKSANYKNNLNPGG